MTSQTILTREQTMEIFKAVNGIGELLKRLPEPPDSAAVKYAIMQNVAAIQLNLIGIRRESSN